MKLCINCCFILNRVSMFSGVRGVVLFLLCVNSSSPYYLMCMCLDIVQE